MQELVHSFAGPHLAAVAPGTEYIQAPCAHPPFDVVLVDGLDRVDCVNTALSALTPAGVMILDDTHRTDYKVLLKSCASRVTKR